MTSRPHDALFKAGFELPEHAAGLFRSALPRALVDAIAWDTMSLEAGSFIDSELADGHSDLLYTAQLGGAPAFLYLLLEHQSTNDPEMPLRMLVYMVRIWERFRREHSTPQGTRSPLPPILPVLVSHAPGGWTAPRRFEDLLEPLPTRYPDLADFVPRFSLCVEDLAHLSNADLKAFALAAFPKVVLWALRDARGGRGLLQNFDDWADAVVEAWRSPSGGQALGQLVRYFHLVSDDLQLDEIRAKLRGLDHAAEQVAMTIAEQMRREGAAEGLAEGLAAGRVQVLTKLLTLKFGIVSAEQMARIEAATVAQLDRYVERVLTAETLDAVLAE